MSWHSYVVKALTLGVVNYQTGNLIIKDPITGTGNGLKQIKDALFDDFSEGVWIGKKTFDQDYFGFSTYLRQNQNKNNLHYVLRVDGQNWHLCQGQTTLVAKCTDPEQTFEWFYKGETKNEIRQFIKQVNQELRKYRFIKEDNQDVVKALYYYARGFKSIGSVKKLLFSEVGAGEKTGIQIMNLILS